MKTKKHSRWLVLASLALGALSVTGPCGVQFATQDDADRARRQLAQLSEQTGVSAASDVLYFVLDSILVRLGG